MRTALFALLAILLVSLTACSGQDQHIIRLDYRPTKTAAPTATGAPVGVAVPTESHGLAVSRLGETIVADVVTQSGRKTANVLVSDSIPKWVGNAVVNELKAAGVNAGLGLEPDAGRVIVKTEITQLKNEVKSQWSSSAVTTTIGLTFRVERDNAAVGTAHVTGQAKVEAAKKLTDNIHDAMELALRDALKKATPELVKLVRPEPRAGY
jgi:hypothetical protein